MVNGEVLVYEEDGAKRHPVSLRAVVLPDGETLEVEHRRFQRDQERGPEA
jgi:hypothetical protein